jgi:uncharacterized protein YecT (DUF1311 family)
MKYLMNLLVLCLFVSINVFGQDKVEKKYPIDSLYQVCLDSAKNQNTYGMIHCACEARDAWDKEIGKYIGLLGEKLSTEDNEQLKTNQKIWLTYRDSEVQISGKIYGKMDGMKWKAAAFDRQAEILRQRALDLKAYYEALKQNTK